MQNRTSMVNDANLLESDSDSEDDLDTDAMTMGSSARVVPCDVGFSDFDDFGGFQAHDETSSSSSPSTAWPSNTDGLENGGEPILKTKNIISC